MSGGYRLQQRARDGIYRVTWTEDGRTRSLSLGTRDRSEAERGYAQFIAGLDNPAPPSDATVEDVLRFYEEAKRDKVRSPDAIKYAAAALSRHLGSLEPGHLVSTALEKYAVLRAGEGAANGTIVKDVQMLRAAVRFAAAEGWKIDVLPMPMPVSAPPPRDRWLTRDEARSLLEATPSLHLETFIVLGLTTAARSGAIVDLTWDRVDLRAGLIDYGAGHGNKRRVVSPMNDRCRAAVEAAAKFRESDYVIEWRGKPVRKIKTAFNKARARAGLSDDVTPHILRHTSATWMAQAGVKMGRIAQMLGDSIEVVERVYAKHHPDYLKDAANAVDF
jgi:integrase